VTNIDDDYNHDDYIIIIIQFFIIYVPSQQLQGQLQTQHSVDTIIIIMGQNSFQLQCSNNNSIQLFNNTNRPRQSSTNLTVIIILFYYSLLFFNNNNNNKPSQAPSNLTVLTKILIIN
jgi:hypothetical protein